jgi:hypothetical protein
LKTERVDGDVDTDGDTHSQLTRSRHHSQSRDEHIYRLLFNASAIEMFIFSMDLRLLDSNDEAVSNTGLRLQIPELTKQDHLAMNNNALAFFAGHYESALTICNILERCIEQGAVADIYSCVFPPHQSVGHVFRMVISVTAEDDQQGQRQPKSFFMTNATIKTVMRTDPELPPYVRFADEAGINMHVLWYSLYFPNTTTPMGHAPRISVTGDVL